MTEDKLVEHFFRHEYGRLVSLLSCRVGVNHIDSIEDAVQSALMKALETWTISELPENPSAWVFQVARNNLYSELRQRTKRYNILVHRAEELIGTFDLGPKIYSPVEVKDDLLRMLFVCCDPAIPQESQLVLGLKVLCGFSIQEIAQRLFSSEASIYKKLSRARHRLRELPLITELLGKEEYSSRLPAVNKVLYLLFTEGYLSTHVEFAVRRELCSEAIRLTLLLAEHPLGQQAETFALLALMYFQWARINARQDGSGGLLLLEEQDRELWNRKEIERGFHWLGKSAHGENFSRYHAEAGIAAEHCLAPSFRETQWNKIVECYEQLEQITPSPLHRLNRAIATAEWKGPQSGLAILEGFEPPSWLINSYMWSAVLADLHQRCGHTQKALQYRNQALSFAPSPAIKDLLKRRLPII